LVILNPQGENMNETERLILTALYALLSQVQTPRYLQLLEEIRQYLIKNKE